MDVLNEHYTNAKQGILKCSLCERVFAPQSILHTEWLESANDFEWSMWWPVLRVVVICTPCKRRLDRIFDSDPEIDTDYQVDSFTMTL